MPNWCANYLKVSAVEEAELVNFLNVALEPYNAQGEDLVSCVENANKLPGDSITLESYLPMPDIFRKYDTLNFKNRKVGDKWGWGENAIVITEELVKEYQQAEEEMKTKYGVTDWYDWRVKNHGPKWNADLLENSELVIEDNGAEPTIIFDFTTANSPVVEFLINISTKFPKLKFELAYNEPGFHLLGVVRVYNGKVHDLDNAEIEEEYPEYLVPGGYLSNEWMYSEDD